MCNINVFIKTTKKTDKEVLDLTCFLSNVTTNSYLSNPEGDGFYFSEPDYLIKSQNKINILNFIHEIKDSKFIISHQRIATSGRTEDYLQPFQNDDFVLIHNGILGSFVRGEKSDTYGLFLDFNKNFKNNQEKGREERIIKALQTLLDSTTGSYSICLFDKKTNVLYYFKNAYTDIHIYRKKDKSEVFITTSKENKEYLDLYDRFNEISIKDYAIYKFSLNNEKVNINYIAKLTKPQFDYNYYGYPNGIYYNFCNKPTNYKVVNEVNLSKKEIEWEKNLEKRLKDKEKQVEEFKNTKLIEQRKHEQPCSLCKTMTKNFDTRHKKYLCDECLMEEEFLNDYISGKYEADYDHFINHYH